MLICSDDTKIKFNNFFNFKFVKFLMISAFSIKVQTGSSISYLFAPRNKRTSEMGSQGKTRFYFDFS